MRGTPTTEGSKRATDRAPHMGEYVRSGKRFGEHGVHIVVENQAFFMPIGACDEDELTPEVRATWMRDMLCIALDRLVEMEIERRAAKPEKKT